MFISDATTIKFIISFFKSKHISLITIIMCWDYDAVDMMKQFSKASIRSQFIHLNHLNEMFPSDPLYPVGVVTDVNCHTEETFNDIAHDVLFDILHHWLFIDDSLNGTNAINLFESLNILPNSEVIWSRSNKRLIDVYKIKKNSELIFTEIMSTNENNADLIVNRALSKRGPTIIHRKDFQGVNLSCATVITFPLQFTSMDDLKLRHVDTWTKSNYPMVQLLSEDLNFRLDMIQLDNFGWETNGSFDGLMGMLQRKEIEFGVTGAFLRTDRMKACDFAAATFKLRACIIFRTPPLSTMRNIFLLPFNRKVWLTCLSLCLFITIQLGVEFMVNRRYYLNNDGICLKDFYSFIVGAFCQQGFHWSPNIPSVRIIFLFTYIASVFLYTSYSANIITLLQSLSASIQSINDLALSPITVGIQNTTYNKVYLIESNDPGIQLLKNIKITPQGSRAYMNPNIGVERIRSELFAFQVETSAAYKWISETFTEAEKCQLVEIEAFSLPALAIPIVKKSAYKELFAQRLAHQRSAGLIAVWKNRWVATAPKCAEGAIATSFKSVSLREFLPALKGFIYGGLIAIFLLIIEFIYHYIFNWNFIH